MVVVTLGHFLRACNPLLGFYHSRFSRLTDGIGRPVTATPKVKRWLELSPNRIIGPVDRRSV